MPRRLIFLKRDDKSTIISIGQFRLDQMAKLNHQAKVHGLRLVVSSLLIVILSNFPWKYSSANEFLETLTKTLGNDLPIIVEDLGYLTQEVFDLRDKYGFPGMRVLQFAFGFGPENIYLPHNYISHCIGYTGTHDNNTTSNEKMNKM